MIADRYIRRTVEAVALLSPFMGTLIGGFPISIIDFMMVPRDILKLKARPCQYCGSLAK